jgi:hypothetical protein
LFGELSPSTIASSDIDVSTSWVEPKSLGVSGNSGWDYFVICDDRDAYLLNTPGDSSHKIYYRKITLANFPAGWETSSVASKTKLIRRRV